MELFDRGRKDYSSLKLKYGIAKKNEYRRFQTVSIRSRELT